MNRAPRPSHTIRLEARVDKLVEEIKTLKAEKGRLRRLLARAACRLSIDDLLFKAISQALKEG